MPRSSRNSPLPRVAIVVSRYNATVTDRLLQAAVLTYKQTGGRVQDLYIAEAPGAFDLIPIAAAAAECGLFAGVLALGCIIKGETRHDEYLAHAVTSRLADIAVFTGVPVALGVLTVNSAKQALERAGGSKGNKGAEAMDALLQTISEVSVLRDGRRLSGAIDSGVALGRLMTPSLASSPDKLRTGGRSPRARRASGRGKR